MGNAGTTLWQVADVVAALATEEETMAVDQAELRKQALRYLERDEGILPHEVNDIIVKNSLFGNCTVSFPEFNVMYWASCWMDREKKVDWLFLR
jgi:hypothetical protein